MPWKPPFERSAVRLESSSLFRELETRLKAFQMTMQFHTKALDAYQEVMRMQF